MSVQLPFIRNLVSMCEDVLMVEVLLLLGSFLARVLTAVLTGSLKRTRFTISDAGVSLNNVFFLMVSKNRSQAQTAGSHRLGVTFC